MYEVCNKIRSFTIYNCIPIRMHGISIIIIRGFTFNSNLLLDEKSAEKKIKKTIEYVKIKG